jgi:predicted DNA-binding transcriptional regulator AlpA
MNTQSAQKTLLSDKDLASRWSVHRVTPWEWARQGRIPKPVKISTRCTRWKLADIEAWEARQEATQ